MEEHFNILAIPFCFRWTLDNQVFLQIHAQLFQLKIFYGEASFSQTVVFLVMKGTVVKGGSEWFSFISVVILLKYIYTKDQCCDGSRFITRFFDYKCLKFTKPKLSVVKKYLNLTIFMEFLLFILPKTTQCTYFQNMRCQFGGGIIKYRLHFVQTG